MTQTFEEIVSVDGIPSEDSDFPKLKNVQSPWRLDPIDAIYMESEYFTPLYNLGLDELVNYAQELNIRLEHEVTETHLFKILRTVIYYIDSRVQQALLEYNIPNITCQEQTADGRIVDPITHKVVNPYRLVAIPEDDPATGHCFDIVSLSRKWEPYYGSDEDWKIKNPVTYKISPNEVVDHIMRGEEKAWWAAYREDFNQHVPYIPESDRPHKYKYLYEFTDLLEKGGHINNTNRLGDTLLMLATKMNNIERMRKLLTQGANPNSIDNNGNTALMIAVMNGENKVAGSPEAQSHIDAIKLLLRTGADPDVVNFAHDTALIIAARLKCMEIIIILLEANANINKTDIHENTAVFYFNYGDDDDGDDDDEDEGRALQFYHELNAKQLLNNYIDNIDHTNHEGQTALFTSSYHIAVFLLDNHANIHATDIYKRNAIFYATTVDKAKLLIYRGINGYHFDEHEFSPLFTVPAAVAKFLLDDDHAVVDHEDDDGKNALFHTRDVDKARILIEHGINMNKEDHTLGKSVLFDTTDEIAKLFIEYGININHLDHTRRNALFDAHTLDRARLLIDNGINIHHADNEGLTALFSNYKTDIVNLLIERGIDIHHTDKNGNTALFKFWNAGITKLLVDNGIDIHHVNNKGQTALFTNLGDGMRIIVQTGADVNYTDPQGNTPLFYVRRVYDAQTLIEGGADIFHKNNNNQTVLFLVHYSVVKFLVDKGVSVNHVDDKGNTAIFYPRNPEKVTRLIANGIDVNHTNHQGETALFNITARVPLGGGVNVIGIIDKLVTNGIRINHRDHNGITAIQTMTLKRHIKYLYRYGAQLDDQLFELVHTEDDFISNTIPELNETIGKVFSVDEAQFISIKERSYELYEHLSELYSWRFARWAVENSIIMLKCCRDVKRYTYRYDEEINRIIRNKEVWEDADIYQVNKNMLRALDETTPLPEDTVVYRGIEPYGDIQFDKIQIGGRLDMRGFLSFTIDPVTAKGFTGGGDGMVLETIFPAGLNALFLDYGFYTSEWTEREMLTYPNLQFEVVSKEISKDNYRVVRLRKLP